MEKSKIVYNDDGRTFIATGEIISEDDSFLVVNDQFEGEMRIGKRFIVKITKVGRTDGLSRRT